MHVADDGRARLISPLRCVFCEQYDADRQDRFVGVPKSGQGFDGKQVREKVFTVPEMTDQLFAKTDMEALRNGDVNERAAAAKLEETTLQSLLTMHERFTDEDVKLVRICRACWDGAEAGRRPALANSQRPYWLKK